MDTYLAVTIPDIWSPLHAPVTDNNNTWAPYSFRWIDNLGSHMIKEVTITCGSVTLHKFTGEYLAAMVERDFSEEKKKLMKLKDNSQYFLEQFTRQHNESVALSINTLCPPSSFILPVI